MCIFTACEFAEEFLPMHEKSLLSSFPRWYILIYIILYCASINIQHTVHIMSILALHHHFLWQKRHVFINFNPHTCFSGTLAYHGPAQNYHFYVLQWENGWSMRRCGFNPIDTHPWHPWPASDRSCFMPASPSHRPLRAKVIMVLLWDESHRASTKLGNSSTEIWDVVICIYIYICKY